MTLAQRALQIANAQVGVHEDPGNKNTGPQVNAYLKSVGLGPGYSWCMAFLYWCFEQAAKEMDIKNPMYKTGGVLKQWNESKLKYGVISPQPGDIGIMDFGGGFGHTFIVDHVEGIWVYTIEGNSNDEGSREGFEVCKRRRISDKVKGFLRFR